MRCTQTPGLICPRGGAYWWSELGVLTQKIVLKAAAGLFHGIDSW